MESGLDPTLKLPACGAPEGSCTLGMGGITPQEPHICGHSKEGHIMAASGLRRQMSLFCACHGMSSSLKLVAIQPNHATAGVMTSYIDSSLREKGYLYLITHD